MGQDNHDYTPDLAQLTVFGIVTAIPKRTTSKLVFTTSPTQYMLPLKDYASSPRQPFPIRCKLDLTSPRYKKADGKPWAPEIRPNGRVLLYGSINRIVQKPDGSAYPKQINYIKFSVSEVVYSVGGNQIVPKIEPSKQTPNYFN